jgi:hypothetical protein
VLGYPWHRELLCAGQIGGQPRHQGAYLLLDHRHEYQDEPDDQADHEQDDEHHGQRARYAAAEEAFDQRLEDVCQHEPEDEGGKDGAEQPQQSCHGEPTPPHSKVCLRLMPGEVMGRCRQG